MYERLVEFLRTRTVEDSQGWTITTFHDFFTVEAKVKETASDRHGAWALANNTCDAILDLGYEFADAISRIGIEWVWGAEPPAWQGTIELRLKPLENEERPDRQISLFLAASDAHRTLDMHCIVSYRLA